MDWETVSSESADFILLREDLKPRKLDFETNNIKTKTLPLEKRLEENKKQPFPM